MTVSSHASTWIALFVCLFLARQPPVGQGLLIHEISRSHTTTHHSRYDSSRWVISSSQRPLQDNTQHSQQTNIHASGGIRTHNPSSRAAASLSLRPRGHWDRHIDCTECKYFIFVLKYLKALQQLQFKSLILLITLRKETYKTKMLTHWGRGRLNCLNARSRSF